MTATEILEAIGKSPEIKAEVIKGLKPDIIGSAQALGVVIRTPEEDTTYVNNQVQAKADAKADELFSSKWRDTLNAQDAEIATLSGIKKNPSEKTTDYLKRAIGELRTKGGDPDLVARIKELERINNEKEAEYTNKLKEKDTQLFQTLVDTQYETGIADRSFVIPQSITKDEDKQRYVAQQKEALRALYKTTVTPKQTKDGLHYYKGEQLLTDDKGQPLSAGAVLEKEFGMWFLPKGHQQGGSGGIPPGGGAGGKFQNKKEIHEHLAKKGLDVYSQEYATELEKLAKDNNIAI
jgi:hypothetical protein